MKIAIRISWREICEVFDIPLTPPYATEQESTGLHILCPFHREKAPSLKFWDKSGRFYCHGCHVYGDKIDFISRIIHLSMNTEDRSSLLHLVDRFDKKIRSKRHDPLQITFEWYETLART